MKKRKQKPALPILHHMARSGGTIISRCIGCMQGIVLLSEIHPFGYERRYINPLAQAHEWYGLLTPEDVSLVLSRELYPFAEGIALIRERCEERGLTLVIRDWSHIDFTGWPHNPAPAFRLSTAQALTGRFKVVSAATVRHPIDQWLSFAESQSWTGEGLTLEQ